MNTATLTAKIAALPPLTRHIVAGICAYKLSDGSKDFAPMWELCRDHGKHYEWPSIFEIAEALLECGLRVRDYRKELSVYDGYGDNVETAAVFRHRYDDTETYGQAADRKRAARRFELCGASA